MKLTKLAACAATAATLLISAGSAQALTVAGVTWNPESAFDFRALTSVFENTTATVGTVINGHGEVSQVNTQPLNCAGCEVTYTFGGFTLAAITATNFAFTGGWINVYVDTAQNFDPFDDQFSEDGTLWLSLAAKVQPNNLLGWTLIGNLSNADPLTLAGTGNSYMDVVYSGDLRNPETLALNEGVANFNLDTNNAQNQCVVTAGVYCPDLLFNSSFAYDEIVDTGSGGEFTHQGSATLIGNSQVPEPGVLALLGLGLAGLGVARRMKKTA